VQSQTRSDQLFTRATARLALLDGRLRQTLGVGFTDYDSTELVPNNPPSPENGDRLKADWQGDLQLAPGQLLSAGAEGQRDRIRNSPVSASVTNAAGFVQLQSSVRDRLYGSASVRYDSNTQFGRKATYHVAAALKLPETGTRLKASVGTGFKAPTLNELYVSFPAFGFFANPDLRPETSLGYDVGFEQALARGRLQLGATWFHNAIRNLITANADFTTSVNIGRATTYGVEAFIAWRPSERLSLRGDYTWTHAFDAILHQELLRRPRHKASVDVQWRASRALTLTGTALYVGDWIDGDRDFFVPRLTAPGYVTANVTAEYHANAHWALFGRITNLADRRYQDPVGFLAPGRGIFGGVRASF
jgi:vitamin B12 transporter